MMKLSPGGGRKSGGGGGPARMLCHARSKFGPDLRADPRPRRPDMLGPRREPGDGIGLAVFARARY